MSITIIPPKTISLLTTYKCTAACKNCCFGCNPKIREQLSVDEMKSYIDKSLSAYRNTLKVLVLTGGECMLLGNKIYEIIKHGKENGLLVRIVTNGYWAKSYRIAFNKLQKLKNAGLYEINFSTGDDHLEWVPYENIVNGCMASVDLGLTCIVNVEKHDKSIFKVERFFKDERLKSYLFPTNNEKPNLKIESGVWIKFNKESEITYKDLIVYNDNSKGCTTLFNTISINPYSQMLACCGLTSEYIIPLRLGSVKESEIKHLYESQFQDFLKIWLFIEGPMSILKFIYEKRKVQYGFITGHICNICSEIFKERENIEILQLHYKEAMARVLLKYSLYAKSICLT